MSNIYERFFQNGLIEGLAKHGFKLAPEGVKPPEGLVPYNMSDWTWSPGMGSESTNTYNSETKNNHLFVTTDARIERIFCRFKTTPGKSYRFNATARTDPYISDSSGNGPLIYFSTSSDYDLTYLDSSRVSKLSTYRVKTSPEDVWISCTAQSDTLCIVLDLCYLRNGNRLYIDISNAKITEY